MALLTLMQKGWPAPKAKGRYSERDRFHQVHSDRAFLWCNLGPARDMTGGYVDQDDLELILSNPTKATARKILINHIRYWFDKGTENNPFSGCWRSTVIDNWPAHYERVCEIYGRYIGHD